MSSDDRERWLDLWAELEFWDAIFKPFTETMGMAPFTLIIGTVLTLSLYTWSRSLFMPAIVLALFGGLIVATAPAQAAFIGAMMVIIAVTLALLSIRGDV